MQETVTGGTYVYVYVDVYSMQSGFGNWVTQVYLYIEDAYGMPREINGAYM